MQKKLFTGILSLFALIAATAYVSKLYFSVENTLSKRCNEGDSASCYSLGILHENSSSAFDYFKKGCDNNHAQSCQYLGNLINGTNDLMYMQKACEHNSVRACFALGEESKNADKNSNVTVKYFKKSCENGDKKGCFELASIEYDRYNVEKSLYLFGELCEKNVYEAC
jgi:TPR repeat protein